MELYSYKDNPLYRDRYERKKRWLKVLPQPGRPLQTSELIEIQSLLADHQKQVLNIIYKSGTILSGLAVFINELNEANLQVTITEGQLYIEGLVVDIDTSNQIIPTTGNHSIGVLVEEFIIDENDDVSLRSGGNAYGLEGSARLIWEASIAVNNPNAISIATVEEGVVIQPYANRQSKVEDQLVTYLADKDGSFVVRGLTVEHIDTIIPNTVIPVTNTRDQQLAVKEQTVNDLQASLIEMEARISSLRQKLTRDTQDLNNNPSPTNLSKVQATIAEIESLTNNQELIKEQLNTEKLGLAELSLSTRSNRKQQVTEVLSVTPGLAYISGQRVSLPISRTINIPKSLEEKSVDGVKFTYRSSITSFNSSLILGVPIAQVIDNTITLNFRGLPIDNISAIFTITNNEISVEDILLKLVSYLNNPSSIQSNISITSTPPSSNLLSLLSNYLDFSIGINNSLIINPKVTLSTQVEISVSTSNNSLIFWDVRTGLVRTSIVSNSYQLDNRDITSVNNFIADLKQTSWQMSRNPNTDIDYLGEDSIFRILNVTSGSIIYREGIDYRLEGQSSIIWLNNSRPIGGSTYYVDYIYTDILIEDTDFTINKSTGVIRFTDRTPAPGYTFTLNYKYSIPKTIYIYLDKNSTVSYSDNLINEESYLLLATAVLSAQSVTITQVDNRALSPTELYSLNRDIKENLALLAQLELDLDTYQDIAEENIDNPIGSFSDALDNLSRIDLDSSTFSLAPASRSITPLIRSKAFKVKYISGGVPHYPSQPSNYSSPNYVTLPFSTTELIRQNRATRYRPISPTPTSNYRGRMYLDSDFHSFTESRLYPGELINTSSSSNLSQSLKYNTRFIYCPIYEALTYSLIDNYYICDKELSTLSAGNNLLGSLSIFIKVEGLKPNEDNLNLYLDNKRIDISYINSLSGTVKGVLGLRSSSTGSIQVKVQLLDLKCGTHLLELRGLSSYSSCSFVVADIPLINYLSNLCESTLPYNQVPRDIALPYSGLNQHRFSSIIQQFIPNREALITDISIRFKQVGEGSITLSIREEGEYGLPSQDILVLGQTDTYWYDEFSTQSTVFQLDYPLYVSPNKKYFIDISSTSEDFHIFTAQVGERDLLNRSRIGSQLLSAGGLLVSKDGLSLSNFQDEDLSYVVQGALFQPSQMVTVELGKYGILNSFSDISHFSYFSKDIKPIGTDIKYQYRTSSNTQWIDFKVGTVVKLGSLVSHVEVRALITNSSNTYLSSLLDTASNYIVLSSPSNNSKVTYKTIDYQTTFSNVRVNLQAFEPPGSLTRGYIEVNNSLVELRRDSSIPLQDYPSIHTITFSISNLSLGRMKIVITQYSDSPNLIPFYRNFKSYVW